MKQRLGLAEVLIKQPEVIILDEPTLGIDPTGGEGFPELIRQLNQRQGLTILLSSHHLHQVQQVCNRVGIFVGGHLLAEGNIETLAANLFNTAPYMVQVTIKTPITDGVYWRSELLQMPAVSKVTADGTLVEISDQENITPDIVRFFVGKGFDVTGENNRKSYGLDEIYQQYFENNLKENASNEKVRWLISTVFFRQVQKALRRNKTAQHEPFFVMVRKEAADQIHELAVYLF